MRGAPGREKYYEKDPWYPLTMFFLLRRSFGWEPFTKLFAEFRALPNSEKPKSEAEKQDQFLTRFSALTGHNLTDYLAAWGVAASPQARSAVSQSARMDAAGLALEVSLLTPTPSLPAAQPGDFWTPFRLKVSRPRHHYLWPRYDILL